MVKSIISKYKLVIEVFGVEFFIYLGMNAYLSKFIIQFVVLYKSVLF